mmetsp:Transcript_78638/g.138661  ORF Transcript_78638/g.138661 Transcript_78638/m.138661 type:complete len:288 (-) Transcript_78638:36-899(-)
MDLASLQNELKGVKEKWEDTKLGKAKKEAETFPFPVWVMLPVQQPPNAKALDVYELPVKLLIDGLEAGKIRVEVPSTEIPAQLQEKISEAVLTTWKKQLKKKPPSGGYSEAAAGPWGIAATFEYAEANFAKLLMLDPECLHPYEGVGENDCSMRRYAVGPPAAPAPEEESEEESDEDEEDDEEEQRAIQARIAELLLEVEGDSSGKKKLSPEEVERRKKEAEEMGEKSKMLSKKERDELNKSRKEKSGSRLAKTGQKCRKFEGDGAVSKDEKKKKNDANVKKRFGLA